MRLDGIDHYTIRAGVQEVDHVRDFYRDVLGLREGPRPSFAFPGYWMYLGETPVVHIAGNLAAQAPATAGSEAGVTRGLDHVSFRARDAKAVGRELDARGITWRGTPVPGTSLYQLFFYDPAGVKVELTFYDGEV